MSKLRNFFNDEDGFSPKDFLMIVFVTIYALEHVATFIIAAFGLHYKEIMLGIVEALDPIVMTIIGGVFSLHAVREFRKTPSGKTVAAGEPTAPTQE